VSTRTARLDWALHLASRGWPLFPAVRGGKEPALHGDTRDRPCPRTGVCRDGHKGWEQCATTDPAVIERYWRAHPDHNIGLATGPAGLVVIDLDVAKPGKTLPVDCRRAGAVHGAQMLSRLALDAGQTVPDTYTVRTPSVGTHLYFQQPAHLPTERQLRLTKGRVGLIDTRAWGGYVIAPSSATPDGPYEVILDTDLPELPGFLADVFGPAGPATEPSGPRTPIRAAAGTRIGDVYVTAAIEGEQAHIRDAEPGDHNRAQWTAGLALGHLIGTRRLDHATALEKLLDAASGHITGRGCHCTQHGVRAAIEWGLTTGARRNTTTDSEGSAA
jgi:hypothetical protein